MSALRFANVMPTCGAISSNLPFLTAPVPAVSSAQNICSTRTPRSSGNLLDLCWAIAGSDAGSGGLSGEISPHSTTGAAGLTVEIAAGGWGEDGFDLATNCSSLVGCILSISECRCKPCSNCLITTSVFALPFSRHISLKKRIRSVSEARPSSESAFRVCSGVINCPVSRPKAASSTEISTESAPSQLAANNRRICCTSSLSSVSIVSAAFSSLGGENSPLWIINFNPRSK